MKHYGVDNVEDLTLVEDTNNMGMNRGFAFLEFSSRSDAMDAFKRLQKRDIVFGVDRPAKVSFADSFIDPGDEIMAQVRSIFGIIIDTRNPGWIVFLLLFSNDMVYVTYIKALITSLSINIRSRGWIVLIIFF